MSGIEAWGWWRGLGEKEKKIERKYLGAYPPALPNRCLLLVSVGE
jgi:hypothetical protein